MFFRKKDAAEIELMKRQIGRLETLLEEQNRILADLPGKPAVEKAVESFLRASFSEFYLAFEDRFRGTREIIKERLKVYLPYLQRLKTLHSDPTLLDAGCGRGEWLELVAEAGYSARGVDSNFAAISRCRQLNLEVVEADVVTYLCSLETASLSCITGFHIVEHLPPDILVSFMHDAYRLLAPGGLLILETPDPENLTVSSHTFYYDPTHRNPLPVATLVFTAEYFGFTSIEILRQHKLADDEPTGNQQMDDIVRRFNMTQDYSVIAWKL